MLHINNKFKPVITKTVMEQDYTTSVVPNMQGKGLNELISKIEDLKVRKNHKKRNADMKISFSLKKYNYKLKYPI
jgi:hypothetical protein